MPYSKKESNFCAIFLKQKIEFRVKIYVKRNGKKNGAMKHHSSEKIKEYFNVCFIP